MTRTLRRSTLATRASALLGGGSLAALALAASFAPAPARAQDFGSMVGMQAGRITGPNGQVSVWTGANRPVIGKAEDGRPLMTIKQTQEKALLDWEDFRLKTNEVLEFQQQSANWIAVNRVHGNQAAEVNGEIRALGKVYIFNDNGVLIGKDAKINTRALVTGRGFSDVNVVGNTTTMVQSSEKALLDWSNMSLQAGEVLKFQQEKASWIALNRSYSKDVTKIAGDVAATGNIYLVAPSGLSIEGKIDAQQVVLSSLFVRDDQLFSSAGTPSGGLLSYGRNDNGRLDPTFSNTWYYPAGEGGYNPFGKTSWASGSNLYELMDPAPVVSDPGDPLRYNVTIGRSGVVTTGKFGKVILAGPNVTNKGTINVSDEGQVILAAGENVYLQASTGGMLEAYSGGYNALAGIRGSIPYWYPTQTVTDEKWRAFYSLLLGKELTIGQVLSAQDYNKLFQSRLVGGVYVAGGLAGQYLNQQQALRAREVGYAARNEGIINAKRGGSVDFRGLSLEQMGAVDITSTALFRGGITFNAAVYDYREYINGDGKGWENAVAGHGNVLFGKGSLTQITPDLQSTDKIPVSGGTQSVGSIKINANSVHMQQDSIIYMPGGKMNVLLDAGQFVFDNHQGAGANAGNEDGTRFLMESGATIDLSGWKTTLAMGYHQVTGKLFAAQLADSPIQKDGPLYRREISIDRRSGTNLANWNSFDNLSQGTLAQFLTDGGSLVMDIGDDFIMKSGSVINVSGGVTTYQDGFVYTTLLRRLDGTIIDIREADPDELYMGLANEWVDYDTKWGKQTGYYIPLMSSVQGKYETSYQQGGKGGTIRILAPDTVLQGTLRGETVAGRYQRGNIPVGGAFILNNAGESESEYVSNNILITAQENALSAQFGFRDKLSDKYGELFGDEYDLETDGYRPDTARRSDNTTLASADFFNRSTMGSYSLSQGGRLGNVLVNNAYLPLDGAAVLVEAGVNLNLANGASFALGADQRLEFLGSIRTEGGDVSLSGMGLKLGADTRIDTRGSWYSDYEIDEPIALSSVPRIHGGDISLVASGSAAQADDVGMILPSTAALDSSGGAWVNRDGKMTGGKGGNLNITVFSMDKKDALGLGALDKARAYGLAGNGAFSLTVSKPLVIGSALPAVDPEAGEDVLENMLIRPEFFQRSGFSAISLMAPTITLVDGVSVSASSATLQLKDQSLHNGLPPSFWTVSGTDIYDVAEVGYLAQDLRPATLRRGMDIALLGTVDLGEGSLLATEIGGKIALTGNAVIAGTLLAPGGAISINASANSNEGTFVHLTKTAKLLAPGASLITNRRIDALGKELVDGVIYNGGSVSLEAFNLTIDGGSLIDVSGTNAVFDLQVDDGRGGVLRRPTMLASNGGAISINGTVLAINDATYRAQAGGAGARGGSFSLKWQAQLGDGGGGSGPSAQDALDQLEQYAGWGFFVDLDGNPISSLVGVDLSTIDWASALGTPLDFAPGFTLSPEVTASLEQYEAAAKGVPPMLVIGDASGIDLNPPAIPDIDGNLLSLLGAVGFTPPTPPEGPPSITVLSPTRIGEGGFSSLSVDATPGMIFAGNVSLGGRKADGAYVFDTIKLAGPQFLAMEGAKVSLEAGVVQLDGSDIALSGESAYLTGLGAFGVNRDNEDTQIRIKAGTLLQVASGRFYGFSDTSLISGGDIRFAGYTLDAQTAPRGTLHSTGKLTFKADQVYAGTGRNFNVTSDVGIEIQAQDDGGPINASPYEAGARLTLRAPTILQGGTLRSPLGTLNLEVYDNGTEGSGKLVLAAGSLTSVSAEGKVIPYGYTSNGDTWLDPFTGLELTSLPTKTINLTGDSVDIASGAVLDVSGGGDLFAREFVPGVGGTVDWLTGYRDADFKWVSSPGQIYAVLPDYAGNIAPMGFGGSQVGIGDKVYLTGGSGLKAGYYTLLPAEYALLPGAFRVTANHRYGNFTDAPIGKIANLTDGSTIQSGYRVDGASGARDQRNIGFHVMPGTALRMRSTYIETTADKFFTSDAFLRKALRVNRPVSEVPRIPLDGGSVVFKVGEALNLNGTLKSTAGKGGRGGFADIAGGKILVAGSDTDLTRYDGYLILKSDQLNAFGAESLLIGGVRSQGATNMELTVSSSDVVIDNAGSVLYGPELLFASQGNIDVLAGAKIESRGAISGSSGDLRILATTPAFIHDNDTSWTPDDDYQVHGVLDRGAVLRVSSGKQVDILRDSAGVTAMNALRADPQALAALNLARASKGLAPIDVNGGLLNIADGASIVSSQSVAFDATNDTLLATGATLQTKQLSASASQISIGAVPTGTGGLVFAGGALGSLGNATDLTLKSYGSIDLYGGVTLAAGGGLRLDTSQIRVLDAAGGVAKISANILTLANSGGGTRQAVAGDATLRLDATNLYIEGDDKWLSGIAKLDIHATERVIGRDDTTLFVPGQIAIYSGGLTTESSARLFLDATGAIDVTFNGNTRLPVFQSFGGTLGLVGASVNYSGQTRITGGTISLQARSGDVVLAQDSILDVTSNVSRFYDKSVGVSAGTVNLIADAGDVVAQKGSLIDVSGTAAGGNAGTLSIRTGQGEARLGGTVRGTSEAGYASGSFNLLTQSLGDFAGFNSLLDAAGFRQSRRFEINSGDVTIGGTVNVQNFAVIANDGSVNVTGTIRTTGRNGGTIQLSAAEDVVLASTAKLLANAGAAGGAGGTVMLETTGRGGGAISTASGSLIDVGGSGEGGRLVRFRAPQLGSDIAIGQLGGTISGARSVIAEGYRVYDGVSVIDQNVIDLVQGDAIAFMAANADAIRNRLGTGVTLTAGIELRSDGDMTLATDWDLSGVRFDGAAGVLTLRAAGDLKIDADLTDGFVGNTLMNGDSWAFNLTAGANIESPDSMAVLSQGMLNGAGSVIIGGKPDTIEYYYDPEFGNENRLYLIDEFGRFVRDQDPNAQVGYIELTRDADGQYLDPSSGQPIAKDPLTGDYVDTGAYARRPLPWLVLDNRGYPSVRADGSLGSVSVDGMGNIDSDLRDFIQWNNSTGHTVRTGTGAINVAAGRDLMLQERASVIYTAGQKTADLAGFTIPTDAQYGQSGGDLRIQVAGDINASGLTPQMPSGYQKQAGRIDQITGLFSPDGNGGFEQTTWWIDYGAFQGGIGALGGGNVDIVAGGDIDNLGVAIPNSGRTTGNTVKLDNGFNTPIALTLTGGGNLALRAGGNLYGGAYYVASGTGDLNVGGSILAGSTVYATPTLSCAAGCDIQADYRLTAAHYDLYTMFFTSSGQLDIKSGGDLNIESVMDPLINHAGDYQDYRFVSYTDAASARLFSAGGDVTLWNNGLNISLAYFASGPTKAYNRPEPVLFYGNTSRPITGRASIGWDLYPSTVTAVAATGDVRVLGGMTLLPSATGQLDLLAGGNVFIGYGTQAVDPFLPNLTLGEEAQNYRGSYEGIFMSQAKMELIRTPTNQSPLFGNTLHREVFRAAGGGGAYPGVSYFTVDNLPDLHVGDTQPVRIYAAGGDIVTSNMAVLEIPKQTWLQAEGNIYFPSYALQHNNPNDVSIVRAGSGIYFDRNFAPQVDGPTASSFGHITLSGPGRLEVEAGTDIWLPSNALGISTQRVKLFTFAGNGNQHPSGAQDWHPDEKAADIAISTGFNETPSYQAFEDAYLNPGKAAGMADYLREDDTGLSLYLFDREYARAEGATGEFATPEPREGLVNYVRRLQGLDPLETKAGQRAYLDTAWSYWNTLSSDFKTPYYRSVLFLELRTTGREANDAANERYNTSFRGYKAIETLFPGAQKDTKTALAEGESRWAGNFETYASRVISNGGGKIEFVIPGGAMTLANVAASPAETGQPAFEGDRGNALRAGVVTNDGGEINILAHNSVAVNQSRILTSKGGNVLIWSSWGDIAAGQGAKTSISPQFYNYALDNWARMNREPAGLPTGAGIGTVATQPGTPPADVDLIAPAGIVDAGDAGIRVSGNFNVYAIEVLGTDNIDVAGVQTGLPVPPAAPPTSLDTGEVGAKSAAVDKALDEAVSQVRKNAAIVSPSLIEVRVTGYGNCGGDQDPCPGERDTISQAPVLIMPHGRSAPTQVAMRGDVVAQVAFNIDEQPLDDAIRAVGRASGFNILYDAAKTKTRTTRALRGNMTPEEALRRLLSTENLVPVRIGPRTIMLRRQTI
ncbi:filamentous haemagglutinin family protein [Sphingomonas psychrotolerans]|nr:filamentous haemagglutinin family protein [Sphingomonas psychrotolerans]